MRLPAFRGCLKNVESPHTTGSQGSLKSRFLAAATAYLQVQSTQDFSSSNDLHRPQHQAPWKALRAHALPGSSA
eukprot:8573017-Karenia_brevis.AAC.1